MGDGFVHFFSFYLNSSVFSIASNFPRTCFNVAKCKFGAKLPLFAFSLQLLHAMVTMYVYSHNEVAPCQKRISCKYKMHNICISTTNLNTHTYV